MFKRLGNLVRGFLGLFVSGIEKKNPEALLEVEKENLRTQIAKYNQGLAAHAGLCEKLISQVKRLEKEIEEIRTRTAANLKAGNRELAGQLALRFKTLQNDLAENRAQLEDAEKTYKELIQARDASVKAAQKRIEEISRGISQVKMHKAMAEMKEMAAGLVTEIGGAGDTLGRLHEMIEEEKANAAGRARVAGDALRTTDAQTMAGEQKALEEMALADFAAAEGLSLSSTEAPASADLPQKVMIDPGQQKA
jgi:phage shock protein A